MTIYVASRDLMRMRNADWHDKYTMPQLWDFYQSTRENHGSYFYDWTTATEVKWRNFYWKYMHLINDYKNMGGRVTTGSDSGFIFETYGFGYIQELELLQEAGFKPLQVVTSATLNGAMTLMDPKGATPSSARCGSTRSPTWSSSRRTRCRTSRRCTARGPCD